MQLLFLFGLTLAAGLFFILLDVLRLPYLSTAKAMLNTTRAEKKAARSFETYLMTFAVKLKYSGDALEYKLSGLDVTIRNAPLAPSSPRNVQRFEADATIWLEVPVYFGGKQLPSMKIKLKVQAGYTEVF